VKQVRVLDADAETQRDVVVVGAVLSGQVEHVLAPFGCQVQDEVDMVRVDCVLNDGRRSRRSSEGLRDSRERFVGI